MSQKHGAYLGGMRTVGDLRKRCRTVEGCDCWIPIRADGGELQKKSQRLMLWVHGVGQISGSRAAYCLQHGKDAPKNLIVYRTCFTLNCVNPEHLEAGKRATMYRLRQQMGKLRKTVQIKPAADAQRKVRSLVRRVPNSIWAVGAMA